MKIAIASSGLGHVARGMEAWAESLAKALNERNVEVTLFKGAGSPKHPYETVLPTLRRDQAINHIIAHLTRKGGWRIGLGAPHTVESFFFGLQLLLKIRKGYDIVHVQQGSLALFLQRAAALGLNHVPLILGNGQKAEAEFINFFPYVHFLSLHDKREYIKQTKDQRERWVIPNFIDTDIFKPKSKRECRKKFDLPQSAKIVLTVGMIDKNVKRMDYFIQEAKKCRDLIKTPVHFVVAGSKSEDTDGIVRMGKDLLANDITFLYDLPRDDMNMLYNAADIFVLCSFREALGLAAVEAMSCEKPVICHHHHILEWVVKDGGDAIDLSRENTLSEMMQQYLEDDPLVQKKGCLARQRVLQTFSEHTVIKDVLDMYKNVIDMHARVTRS